VKPTHFAIIWEHVFTVAQQGGNGQWRSKWGTRPGAQALGAHQHTFCSQLKHVLSRNLN